MRFRLPSRQTALVYAGLTALALWSLPSVPNSGGHHSRSHHTHHLRDVVPTMAPASPAQDSVNRQQTNEPKPKSQPPAGGPIAHPDKLPQTQPGGQAPGQVAPPQNGAQPNGFSPYAPYPTAKLRIRVIDGRTQEPLSGAEVVLIETEQRLTTGADGYTPWMDAPIIRNPRYRPLVAELHGQLGVIVYRNGYRDSVHLGIRMHEGKESQTTVWMYKIGPGDDRIEPNLYEVPYHHLWLVELADRFRSKTQPGEGPERP